MRRGGGGDEGCGLARGGELSKGPGALLAAFDESLPFARTPDQIAVGDRIEAFLTPLLALDGATLRARRQEKFLEMGRTGVA